MAKARAHEQQPPDARLSGLRRRGHRHQRSLRFQGQSAAEQARAAARLQAARWTGSRIPTPNDGTFTSSTTYDALNRPTDRHCAGQQRLSPDLQRSQPARQGGGEPARRELTANAVRHQHRLRRQRPAHTIAYGNGAQTTYEYDPLTFRLTHLKTTRAAEPERTRFADLHRSRQWCRTCATPTTRPATSPASKTLRCRRSSTTANRSSRSATTPTTPSTA